MLEYYLKVDLLDVQRSLPHGHRKNLSVTAPFLPLLSFVEVLPIALLLELPVELPARYLSSLPSLVSLGHFSLYQSGFLLLPRSVNILRLFHYGNLHFPLVDMLNEYFLPPTSLSVDQPSA